MKHKIRRSWPHIVRGRMSKTDRTASVKLDSNKMLVLFERVKGQQDWKC